jgi:Tfp pilus assembly protein PilF
MSGRSTDTKRIEMSRALWIAVIAAVSIAVAIAWHFGTRHSAPITATYVDAVQCQACHDAIHRSYRHVAMASSFASVAKAAPIEDYTRNNRFAHPASGRHYEMTNRAGRYFQRRYEIDTRGVEVNVFEQEVTYAIGSGKHARTYLHRSESGELTELPVTWYTQEGRWGMSPGYDNAAPQDFTRIAGDSCLFCHTGYPGIGGALAEGIDCQRCHGPGSRHVELASGGAAAKEDIRAAIVNPGRLSPDLQMDVCMQCHLETTSAELPQMIRRFDREPYSFRPGEPLGAYMVHFDHPAGAGHVDKFEIVNQAYRLRQSLCFRKSEGRLTCITCHDPHDAPRGEAAIAHYREKCVGCHATVKVAGHASLQAANCASCHMPRRRAEDAVHVIMTDHLITRKPPARDASRPLQERTENYRGPLALYYPERLPPAERDLYIGAASITGSADRRHGIELLEKAVQSGAPAKAVAVLGEGYLAEGSPQRAVEMFRQAVSKDPSLAQARYNLGLALEAEGKLTESRREFEQAIRMKVPFPEAHYALANVLAKAGELRLAESQYQDAIRERPVYAAARSNLANMYAGQGRMEEARAELEQSLRVNPAFAEAHNNLARVLATQHRIADALDHARRAVAVNPEYVEARYNLARLLQETGASDAAIAEYRRTLAIKPDLVEAHLSLGQALGDAGKLDAAIAEFREVLRLAPRHAEAQGNLDTALAIKRGETH